MSQIEQNMYIKPEPSIEKDKSLGCNGNWVWVTSIFWDDVVLAMKMLYDQRKSEKENSAIKMKEFRITERNRRLALDERNILHPDTSNYGASAPPDKDHLKM
mgnify:CR=1 FL=1